MSRFTVTIDLGTGKIIEKPKHDPVEERLRKILTTHHDRRLCVCGTTAAVCRYHRPAAIARDHGFVHAPDVSDEVLETVLFLGFSTRILARHASLGKGWYDSTSHGGSHVPIFFPGELRSSLPPHAFPTPDQLFLVTNVACGHADGFDVLRLGREAFARAEHYFPHVHGGGRSYCGRTVFLVADMQPKAIEWRTKEYDTSAAMVLP